MKKKYKLFIFPTELPLSTPKMGTPGYRSVIFLLEDKISSSFSADGWRSSYVTKISHVWRCPF